MTCTAWTWTRGSSHFYSFLGNQRARNTAILTSLSLLLLGALLAWALPLLIVPRVIEKLVLKEFKDLIFPLHTLNACRLQNFIASVDPRARPFLTRKLAARILARLREQHAVRIQAAVKGIRTDEDAVLYLTESGLLAEMNLSPAEARQRLRAIDCGARLFRPRGDHTEFNPLGPPCPPLRLPAEWEPVGAVIVSFPLYDPRGWKVHADFIQALNTEAKIFILVGNEFWQKAVEVYLTSQGVGLENLSFFQIPAEDVWTRDYGPTVVFSGAESQPVMIWNPYFIADQAYYKFDADATAGLAMALDLPLCRLPLVIEGGNLITDGRGTIILSESVLEANPEVDREGLEAIMRDYFGCTRLITLPALPAEITGHIDMAVKFAKEDTLFVACAHPGSKWHGELEQMASRLSQIRAGTGQPFRVIRVPLPRRTASPYCFWSYVNSLTLNRKVIVPMFRVPEDAAALELYRSVMPGYEVEGVDFHRYPVGSAHCQAKGIPAAALPVEERET